jgi:hypothetical protein
MCPAPVGNCAKPGRLQAGFYAQTIALVMSQSDYRINTHRAACGIKQSSVADKINVADALTSVIGSAGETWTSSLKSMVFVNVKTLALTRHRAQLSALRPW